MKGKMTNEEKTETNLVIYKTEARRSDCQDGQKQKTFTVSPLLFFTARVGGGCKDTFPELAR